MHKVPVFQTVAEAFRFWLDNIGLFARQGWYWTLLIFAVQLAVVHSEFSVWLADYLTSDIDALKQNSYVLIVVGTNIDFLMIVFTGPAIAVAHGFFAITWQRALLLGRIPPGIFPVWPDRAVLNTVGFMLLYTVAGLVWVLFAPATFAWLAHFSFWPAIVIPAAFIFLFILLPIYLTRILLAVPAAATGDRYASLYEAYAMSAGNGWRLFAIVAICFWFAVVPHLLLPISDSYLRPGWAHYRGEFNYLAWFATVIVEFAAVTIILSASAVAYRALVSDDRREELQTMAAETQLTETGGMKGKAVAIAILAAAGLAAAWAMID